MKVGINILIVMTVLGDLGRINVNLDRWLLVINREKPINE